MHRAGIAHEVRARPDVPGEELVWRQVAFQPIAGRAGHHEVSRIMGAPASQRKDMIDRGRAMIQLRGTIDTTVSTVAKRNPPHGALHCGVGDRSSESLADRPVAWLCRARPACADRHSFGRARTVRRATLRQPHISAGHQRVPREHGARNVNAPTEESILTSGRSAMSKGSARCAGDRMPWARAEGVGWHRRTSRRKCAGVGGTQRRREGPRVERIILLVKPGGVAQQTAETGNS